MQSRLSMLTGNEQGNDVIRKCSFIKRCVGTCGLLNKSESRQWGGRVGGCCLGGGKKEELLLFVLDQRLLPRRAYTTTRHCGLEQIHSHLYSCNC